ncbi:MAG: ATP-binding protein [Clostridiales bacterium]|nr:ATP-binding protein [Clostridiales bacterium]
MLIGVHIQNFGLFEDDCLGALLDDIRRAPEQSSLAYEAGMEIPHPLNGMEALIGRNHTGKTMFFSFLSFVQSTVISGPAYASTESGRAGFANLVLDPEKPIRATICFLFIHPETKEKTYCEYELVLAANQHGKPHFEEEILRLWRADMEEPKEILHFEKGKGTILMKGEPMEGEMNDPQTSALHAYGSMKQFYFTNCTYREICGWFFVRFSREHARSLPEDVAPGGHKHLNSDGTNARNVLLYMKQERPGEYKQLVARMLEVIPGLRGKEEKDVLDFFKKPDILALFLLLLSDPSPRPLLLIEAPDEGLYHDMVDELGSQMRNFTILNPHCQIMFTTHNPYIIENLSPDEIWVFCRGKKGSIDIRCAGSIPIVQELYKQGVGMGAIWYAGHFDD